ALETDLEPFQAAIDEGVDSIMSAHVAFPALDDSGGPATLSRPILTGMLRERLGFDGLIVTDALIMEGVLEGGAGEPEAAVAAVNAGCDALLYPNDLAAVAAALRDAGDALNPDRVADAVDRIRRTAEAMDAPTRERATDQEPSRLWGREGDREWALGVAGRAIRPLRGEAVVDGPVELITVDDDAGGPFPSPPREDFPRTLGDLGVDAREVEHPTGELPVVVALYADIKGFKGRPGLSQAAIERVGSAIDSPRGVTVVLFGHPRLATETPGARLLNAWGGESLMQEAAARWLTGRR
ncbi:MAG TPA: glycoside hydrolase family 3 N-terminal domain-containing protein, partial [Longimicrobiales bacterium]|nr:glycoside hydrolase family 3 N-terminal domain-containing protein [Longimicrobiales bacterium]